MVMWSNLPKEAMDDCFRPPDEPCQVQCLHCGHQYSSADIVWRETADGGFWSCPIDGCGGAGFQFDIHPIDSTLWSDEEDFDEDELDVIGPTDDDYDMTDVFEDPVDDLDLPF